MTVWMERFKGNASFSERPKRGDRKRMGKEYTDFLLNCLSSEAGKEINDEIVFRENSPVDLVWINLNLGVECKRLKKTQFHNSGHAKAWLRREVISRFIDYARETGKILSIRILCVSEIKWSKEVSEWLESLGYFLIETGQIDKIWERAIAEKVFLNQFTDILTKVYRGVKQIAN